MSRLTARIWVNGTLLVLAVLVLFPLAWMVAVSFMTPGTSSTYPPPLVPAHPTLANYQALFVAVPFANYFRNSAIIALGTMTLALTIGSLAAYGFVRFRFRFRGPLLTTMLMAYMIPSVVLLVP